MVDPKQTCDARLGQLFERGYSPFEYSFKDGCLRIIYIEGNRIQNIQAFGALLAQNSIPIVTLNLSSNLFNILNLNIFISLGNKIRDEEIQYFCEFFQYLCSFQFLDISCNSFNIIKTFLYYYF
jgi:hypothetical protein